MVESGYPEFLERSKDRIKGCIANIQNRKVVDLSHWDKV